MSTYEDSNTSTPEPAPQEPDPTVEDQHYQDHPDEFEDIDEFDDDDYHVPERVDTMWVPDVKPDWWDEEEEKEMRRLFEEDQACLPQAELPDPVPEWDTSFFLERQTQSAWRRDPDASFLQKPHQREYNLGITYPIVTPWDQHITKFNAARNPMKPVELEESRYMKEVKRAQPHRHVCAHDPNPDRQPISTYGHLMLPESYDPIINNGLPDPGFPRLTWSPDTPAPEVLQGAARDLADVGSTFAARLRVSIGHEADCDAIEKFHKVAVAMKNLHSIINAPQPKKRKNLGGRPPKTGRKRRTAKLKIEIETVEKKEIKKPDNKCLAEPQPIKLISTKTSCKTT